MKEEKSDLRRTKMSKPYAIATEVEITQNQSSH